jgi:hypothetical protein
MTRDFTPPEEIWADFNPTTRVLRLSTGLLSRPPHHLEDGLLGTTFYGIRSRGSSAGDWHDIVINGYTVFLEMPDKPGGIPRTTGAFDTLAEVLGKQVAQQVAIWLRCRYPTRGSLIGAFRQQ